jgi:hypothetical protein
LLSCCSAKIHKLPLFDFRRILSRNFAGLKTIKTKLFRQMLIAGCYCSINKPL